MSTTTNPLKAKDFASEQDIRWCPGCGDYSILKQVQYVLAENGLSPDDVVFVSGIGCSSRFPYYCNTYGIHGIHGRATAIASGLKAARPETDVWIVTGDGDSLAIGGNHLIHLLRRNFDVTVLLFNNEIYGLTKGQYSPTSPKGKISKSTPAGSVDHPFNPLQLALGASGTFMARGIDNNPAHLRQVIQAAHQHRGTGFLEIYQNCKVFNSEAFDNYGIKGDKANHSLFLEPGKPLVFGADQDKGIILDGFHPRVVELGSGYSANDCWVHDSSDKVKASLLTQFFEYGTEKEALPRPFGVFYQEKRLTYNECLINQINEQREAKGTGDLDQLLAGPKPWTVE